MKKLGIYKFDLMNFYLSNKDKIGEKFVLLDSPKVNKLSEFSYILANFSEQFQLKTTENYKKSKEFFFKQLRNSLLNVPKEYKKNDFFSGGFFGIVSYDFNRFIEKINDLSEDDLQLPQLIFLKPQLIIVKNELTGEMFEINYGVEDYLWDLENNIKSPTIDFKEIVWEDLEMFETNMNKEKFTEIVNKAKEYIKEGDIFQVNLSQRFTGEIGDKNSLELYRILREINPSPFASYVALDDFKIISQSPERLVRLKDGISDTRPIAGTRRLEKENEEKNKKLAEEMLNDPKECAEHVMLVDLERNDIGKLAKFGTVKVDEFMVVERYSHVMHLVSNVFGELKENYDSVDLLESMFPGGTITGAPKIRSMEIIEELEPTRRGFYTGSLGYIDYSGNMDFNIIIRSFIEKGKKVHFQVGAGIVYDSIPEREYKETINKGRAMILAYHNFMKR
ncbi:MAG: anthranilate synthase component I family protein [Fusobacteriaceae bacterium]|nr:anthranilate synthase component I family protein [Fusobacteriaceae bacterium]MBN2837725.1 anthranilate synthase component I family protein [Fusobacteriaceae bacterium]